MERSKLEIDKAKFLEEAVRGDSKHFVSCPPTREAAAARGVQAGDAKSSIPGDVGQLKTAGTPAVIGSPCSSHDRNLNDSPPLDVHASECFARDSEAVEDSRIIILILWLLRVVSGGGFFNNWVWIGKS